MLTIDHDPLDGWLTRWRERERHIRDIGFVKPTPALCSWIGAWGPWVEIGAGTGALARGINEHGGRCVATDTFAWHDEAQGKRSIDLQWGREGVIRADAARVGRLLARHPSVGLLTSWPEYDAPWAYEAASQLQEGQLLCYIGEGAGGCTADDQFHDLLERDFVLADTFDVEPWQGLHDWCYVYHRCRIPSALSAF